MEIIALMGTKRNLFFYVWLIYLKYFFQYLYAFHLRHVLFQSAIHGFTSVAPCFHINSPIVPDADFDENFHFTPCNGSSKIASVRNKWRWFCDMSKQNKKIKNKKLLLWITFSLFFSFVIVKLHEKDVLRAKIKKKIMH